MHLTGEHRSWVAMLGIENQAEPPEALRPCIEQVVGAITVLRNKEHDIAFKSLGYSDGENSDSNMLDSLVNLDHMDLPGLSQLVGSQFQFGLDFFRVGGLSR